MCYKINAQGAENINPGNTGGTIDCGAFKVSLTEALHSSGTIVNGQSVYLGSPNGLVVKPKDAPSIYHMGDTDLFSDMALIAEIHAPKIGLVPVGDRFTMSGRTARFFNLRKEAGGSIASGPRAASTAKAERPARAGST
jgi:L-ascorbate metabolism protein UlaG (beta-lactamase superfamily)